MKYHQLLRAELEDLADLGLIGAGGMPAGDELFGGQQKAFADLSAKAFRRTLARLRSRRSRRVFH